jgi:hypothetical protein
VDLFLESIETLTHNLVIDRCPEIAKTMIKVPFAATKESLKKSLNLSFEVQATDASELDFQVINAKLTAS